jgi:NAD-dependent deacetylase
MSGHLEGPRSGARRPGDPDHVEAVVDGVVDDGRLALVKSWIAAASGITVLTGAGISTDSGIPDFRGPNGVWTRNPEAEKAATLQNYLRDPEVRQRAWRSRLDNPRWLAEPNRGHLALARLQRTGKLRALVTQNVDGLHTAAGSDPNRIIEVHGTVQWAVCWECDRRWEMNEFLDRVRLGEADPPCLDCGGIVKSDAIMFGQDLVPEVIDAAFEAAEACELFVAIGTTLAVYPVANCVPLSKRAGARVVIINGEPTDMDPLADVVIRGSISEVLDALIPSRPTRDA